MQPVAVPERAKALAAQTKPARAGVRCKASAEPHLTANAGRCEWYSRARMRTAANALAVRHCCANEALQGWCAALAGMSEMQLRANAGCCRASNRLRLQAVAVEAKARLRKWSPEGGVKRLANAVRHAAGCECRLAALETTGYGRRLLP